MSFPYLCVGLCILGSLVSACRGPWQENPCASTADCCQNQGAAVCSPQGTCVHQDGGDCYNDYECLSGKCSKTGQPYEATSTCGLTVCLSHDACAVQCGVLYCSCYGKSQCSNCGTNNLAGRCYGRHCDALTPCKNGATCIQGFTDWTCQCATGYIGRNCTELYNNCQPNPCQNGATCNNALNDYSCACKPGYSGKNCDVNINECVPLPCLNGGTCTDGINSYTCNCAGTGYSGVNCSVNINDCAINPCKNGATCVDGLRTYTCNCVQGYAGVNCSTNLNDCTGPVCQHGGTCVDGIASYSCICPAGWTAANCSEDINECAPNPCLHGGTCTQKAPPLFQCDCTSGYGGPTCNFNVSDACASSPCMNGGACSNVNESFVCNCTRGWNGTDCSLNIDDCVELNAVCLNGGTCIDGLNNYTCACAPGFTNSSCDVNIDDCAPNPCVHGNCTDGVASFSCECDAGYSDSGGGVCDTMVDNCASSPCVYATGCVSVFPLAHTCDCLPGYTGPNCELNIDDCSGVDCQNGGTCQDGIQSFQCACVFGYTGMFCATDINECAPNPCLFGSTCTQGIGYYQCQCATGFTGTNCDQLVNFCNSGPCQNGATCHTAFNAYSCECQTGWGGVNCTVSGPQVAVARFGDSVADITVLFNEDTNAPSGGAAFTTCRTLLKTSSLLIIGNLLASCQWTGRNTLVLRAVPSALVLPNQFLDFRDNIIFSAATGIPLRLGAWQVLMPLNPITPRIALTGQTALGLCTPLALDALASTGLAGRLNAASFVWLLNGVRLTALSSNATKLNYPAGYLPAGPYNVTLQLSNLYARTHTVSVNVTAYAVPLPAVSIDGPVSMGRDRDLLLISRVTFPACEQQNISVIFDQLLQTTAARFEWIPSVGLPLVALNQPYLSVTAASGVLPLSTIGTSVAFQLVFVLGAGANPVSTSANWLVSVVSTALAPVIAGGSYRQVSQSKAFSVDGSPSRDPDLTGINPATVMPFPLSYAWDCVTYNRTIVDAQPCNTSLYFANHPEVLTAATLPVAAFVLPAARYVFVLHFASTIDGVTRTSTTSTEVEILPRTIPDLSLQAPAYVYPSDTLRVFCVAQSASATLSSQLTFSWIETLHNLTLSDPVYRASALNSPSLVLRPGLLQSGLTYEFRVTVVDPQAQASDPAAQAPAFVSVRIPVIAPPCCGACAATPLTGTSLLTLFQVECYGWVDPSSSAPLLYAISYTLGPYRPGLSTIVSLTVQTHAASAQVILPSGNVTLIASVISSLGGVTLYPIPEILSVAPIPQSFFGNDSAICVVAGLNSTLLFKARLLGDTSNVVMIMRLLIPILVDSSSLHALNETATCGGVLLTFTYQQLLDQLWATFLDAITALVNNPLISRGLAEQLADILLSLVTQLQLSTNLNVANTVLQVLRSIISGVVSSKSLAQSIIVVLSEVLDVVACAILDSVTQMIGLLSRLSLVGTLPEEDVQTFLAPSVFSSSTRVFGDANYNITQNDLQFQFNSDVLSAGLLTNGTREFVDVTITRFGKTIRRCRGGGLVGDIVDIDVSHGGNKSNVTGVTFEFYLPIDADVVANSSQSECKTDGRHGSQTSMQTFVCHWWDGHNWTDSGCVTVGDVVAVNGSKSIMCRCTHLTEFGVLLREIEGGCELAPSVTYQAFSIVYVLIGSMALVQIVRQTQGVGWEWRLIDAVFVQHVLIFSVSMTRALACGRFSGYLPWRMNIVSVAAISALPWLLIFWIFTLFIFQWATILVGIHSRKVGFKRAQTLFWVANVCMIVLVAALFISVAVASSNREQIALGGSIVISLLQAVSGFGLIFYGVRVSKTLKKATGQYQGEKRWGRFKFTLSHKIKPFLCTPTIARKLFLFAVVVGLLFFLESLMWVLSIASDGVADDSPAFTGIYLGCEVVALVIVLGLFAKAVNEPISNRTTRSKQSSKGDTLGSGGDHHVEGAAGAHHGSQAADPIEFVNETSAGALSLASSSSSLPTPAAATVGKPKKKSRFGNPFHPSQKHVENARSAVSYSSKSPPSNSGAMTVGLDFATSVRSPVQRSKPPTVVEANDGAEDSGSDLEVEDPEDMLQEDTLARAEREWVQWAEAEEPFDEKDLQDELEGDDEPGQMPGLTNNKKPNHRQSSDSQLPQVSSNSDKDKEPYHRKPVLPLQAIIDEEKDVVWQ